jgi:hypothetical protein
MTTDLGKGDVVVAVHAMSVNGRWTPHGGAYHIAAGDRAIVEEVTDCRGVCTECGCKPGLIGLKLVEYPLKRHVRWCPCEWKKLGPGQEETVAKFAHHLTPARSRVKADA